MSRNAFSFRPKRILYRIILPFTLLFGITSIFSWLFSAYIITRYLDQSLRSQMEQVAGAVSKSSYILNPAILRQIKEIIKSDIVLFDKNGLVIRSTFLTQNHSDALHASIKEYAKNPFKEKDFDFKGVSYRTIVKPLVLPDPGPVFLSIWMPKHDMAQLRTGIIVGLGGISLFGMLMLALVAYMIAKTITAPVEALANVTGKIARGDLSERADINSSDEIGSLAASFNHMLDQVKAFEVKLVASEKQATAGQMAAGLAHEIRNPLTSIKMFGQVLQKRLNDRPDDQKTFLLLVKEIDRLDRIIQEMIERASPSELHLERHNPNEVLTEVIQLAEQSLHAQRIRIQKNLTPDLPEVLMDHEKIKGVIWNLVLNAKDAMPKGGDLALSTRIDNSDFVEIAIEDAGTGFLDEDKERLFQPFFTTKPEGMGLGLAISRTIIEKHGGLLKLENRVEGGTKASIWLPVNGK
ncbi:MAG: ATP-binding protein [Desulfobacterales bacterium]|jgi:signal transduction histidine kinase|nr:ATP-binding protein [Desulfobacterales bacterium]